MLKIIHLVCCGVDVYKKFIVATIASSEKNNVTTYKAKKFSTFTSDLLLFKERRGHKRAIIAIARIF